MASFELPHTPGCLVCGRHNPHGLQLSLHVDDTTGAIHTTFTPTQHHIGFEGVIHGGVIATVLDEAMVWAATWAGRRFCLCGELSVRFRRPGIIGQPLFVTASIEKSRAKVIRTIGQITDANNQLIASGAATYMMLPLEKHQEFVATFVNEPATARAAAILKQG
jgi:uncharacterized protein (TIGR00369 family)